LNRGESKVLDVTVVDLDDSIFEKDFVVSPLLLNIASDAKILWDPEGKLARFLGDVRSLIERAGLTRYRTSSGRYGWKPKERLFPVSS
jgi:hypothetical protein